MKRQVRADVHIVQEPRGRVIATIRYNDDPETYWFEANTVHSSVTSWSVLSKAVLDCVKVGLMACEEYEVF